MTHRRRIGLFILLFLGLGALTVGLLHRNYARNVRLHVDAMGRDLVMQNQGVVESYQSLTDSFYFENESQIAEMLYRVVEDPDAAAAVRREMYRRFVKFYTARQLEGWRQFHIHLPGGVSFLRFHKPDAFGDGLYDLRESLRRINADFRFARGYEIGRYYDGYRFLYPLFFRGRFVGSMEWGIPMERVTRDLRRLFDSDVFFLIDDAEIERVMDPAFKQKFYPLHDEGLHLTMFRPEEVPEYFARLTPLISRAQKMLFAQLSRDQSASIVLRQAGREYLIVFSPVTQIDGESVGYFAVVGDDGIDGSFRLDFFIQSTLALVVIALLLFRLYRVQTERSQLLALLNRQNDMVLLTDGENMVSANETLLQFFGYSGFGEFKREHLCVCDMFMQEAGYLQSQMQGRSWVAYMRLFPKHNHFAKIKNPRTAMEEVFLVKANPVYDNLYTVSFTNVSKMIEEARELERKATHDSLTGLRNRMTFEENLRHELRVLRRYGTRMTLVMFDIDFFKQVNDTYGHVVGDDILVELSLIVKSGIRETDSLYRWGGEEFMILQPATAEHEALPVCRRILNEINAHVFTGGIRLTCSFGLICPPLEMEEPAVLKGVDEALYRAKTLGRNRIEVY